MVVDDHPIWREGVARDLTERGCGWSPPRRTPTPRCRIAHATRPRVVLMDLNLGATRACRPSRASWRKLPERILVLSASGEHADVLEAVKAGATGYLVKSAGRGRSCWRRCGARPTATRCSPPAWPGWCSGEYRRLADEPAGPGGASPALTERETEVLRLVAKGLTARQIGERLGLSHRTVESHVQNTLRKLQLHNRAQLVRYAIEQGLADE